METLLEFRETSDGGDTGCVESCSSCPWCDSTLLHMIDVPCSACPYEGACCSWGTSLSSGEAQAIEGAFGPKALVWDEEEQGYRTRVVDGHCYFLTNGKCGIHSQPYYPQICAGFPHTQGLSAKPYESDLSICPALAS